MVSNNLILVKVEKLYFETIFHSKESEAGSSVLQYSLEFGVSFRNQSIFSTMKKSNFFVDSLSSLLIYEIMSSTLQMDSHVALSIALLNPHFTMDPIVSDEPFPSWDSE